jgi:hypothetical protein
MVGPEQELAIRRQVIRALTSEFLPEGAFRVETLADIDRIHVMVYLKDDLIAKETLVKEKA